MRGEVSGAELPSGKLKADPSQLSWVRFQGHDWGLALVHPA